MAAFDIDMIDTTPSMFAQLRAAGLLDRPLPVLALGGEAIDPALWDNLRALPGTAVFNCYGPTEMTVEAVVAPVKEYPAPTIGTRERRDLRLRPGFGAAAGARRRGWRAVPVRRADGPRLCRQVRDDRGPLRRRPVPSRAAHVSHR